MKHSHHASSTGSQQQARPKGDPAAASAPGSDGGMEVQIREAAYYRYLARGAEAGHDLEDWFKAESELLANGKAQRVSH